MKKKRIETKTFLWTGFILSILYFFLIWAYIKFVSTNQDDWKAMPLNEIGDTLAGVFAPLILAWFVIATLIQHNELMLSRQELELSRNELKITSDTLVEQTKLLADQTNFQRITNDRLKQDLDNRAQKDIRDRFSFELKMIIEEFLISLPIAQYSSMPKNLICLKTRNNIIYIFNFSESEVNKIVNDDSIVITISKVNHIFNKNANLLIEAQYEIRNKGKLDLNFYYENYGEVQFELYNAEDIEEIRLYFEKISTRIDALKAKFAGFTILEMYIPEVEAIQNIAGKISGLLSDLK